MQKDVLCYLERTAKRYPNNIAVTDQDSSINFDTLLKNSLAFAAHLQSIGVSRLVPIGVFLPKTARCIVSFTGIMQNGCFYVPIDIKNPVSRVDAIVKNLGIKFIVTDETHFDILRELSDVELIKFEDINLDDSSKFNPKNRNLLIDTDPLYILNTSGSTGVPKGVTVPHRAIIDYIDWVIEEYKFDENLIIGNQTPFHFDFSASDIYIALATGSTLVIIPENLFMFPAKLVEFLKDKKINFIHWVPSALTSVSKLDVLGGVKLDIKTVFYGGELMPTKHLMYWKRYIPDAVFSNFYGPTETAVISTHYRLDRDFADDEPLPIGYPCKNTDVLVLDENDKLVTDKNILGELCIRGSSLAHGYYNNPEKTNAAFTQNPLNNAYPEKIYRTGDVVYYNEYGELMYKGRKDFQIKHQGYRIELGEIETAVLAIDGIFNACVLYDDENKNIVLIYEGNIEQREILLALRDKLPKYMLPSKFIKLSEMPLNINGKIDRVKLRKLF